MSATKASRTALQRVFSLENGLLHSLWSSLVSLMEGKRLWQLSIRENDSLIGNQMRPFSLEVSLRAA
jgi:hypothetical protein